MPPRERSGLMRRIGRAVAEMAVTIGLTRGVTHGGRGGGEPADRYAAVSMLVGEATADRLGRRARGSLDRVPGWLLLAVIAIGFLLVVFVYDWR
jgi:hypothetical protein